MRKDMAKVIVERPRTGGDGGKSIPLKGTKKNLQRTDWEEMPAFQSNAPGRLYGYDRKQLNENLSPLHRFLRKNVGRPWNDVYSEICENIRVDNAVQSHVRDHVDMDVMTNVVMINGVPYDPTRSYPTWREFYVHPETGILCYYEHKRHRYNRKQQNYVDGKSENHQYHVVEGIWYEVELKDFPPRGKDPYWWYSEKCFDVVKKIRLDRSDCKRIYGREVYAVKKRQLNSKEIKKLKLWESEVGIRESKKKAA